MLLGLGSALSVSRLFSQCATRFNPATTATTPLKLVANIARAVDRETVEVAADDAFPGVEGALELAALFDVELAVALPVDGAVGDPLGVKTGGRVMQKKVLSVSVWGSLTSRLRFKKLTSAGWLLSETR
jgi:hypothetical protein